MEIGIWNLEFGITIHRTRFPGSESGGGLNVRHRSGPCHYLKNKMEFFK